MIRESVSTPPAKEVVATPTEVKKVKTPTKTLTNKEKITQYIEEFSSTAGFKKIETKDLLFGQI